MTRGMTMTKILLVEDDTAIARGIGFSLEKEGFNVTHAENIEMGKSYFENEEFDLLILDVTLPDGNGFDLCKYVRSKSMVPITFLTACDEEIDIVQGLDIGGDDYITKPFRLGEFMSRIKAILRRYDFKKTKTSKEIKCENISLFIDEMKVYKDNSKIFLSKNEYKLLKYFMENPRQILTRDQILSALWDTDGDFIDANTLSVNIRRLREKIEENPSKPKYIQTMRGTGYIWAEGCVK